MCVNVAIFVNTKRLRYPPNLRIAFCKLIESEYERCFFVVDTIRADESIKNPKSRWRDFYSLEQTTVFEEAWSPASGTAPSVKAMFSGHPASSWGRENISKPPPLHVETIPTYFEKRGYSTAGFTANSLINGGGFSAGYSDYLAFGGFDSIKHSLLLKNLLFGKDTMSALAWAESKSVHKVDGHFIRGLGETWLSKQTKDANYLYLHIVDSHWPYRNADGTASTKLSHVQLLQRGANDPLPKNDLLVEMRSRYSSEVEHSAEVVLSFVDYLNETGLRDNTMMVIVGDHGEEFYEHGGFSHGHDSYQEQVNVPLIILWPSSSRGNPPVVRAPFSNENVFEIIKQGSLSPAILATAEAGVVSESYPSNYSRAIYRQGDTAVRIEYSATVSPLESEDAIVFDMKLDPFQQSPLSHLVSP